jgi:vitamin B12 transporter
MTTPLIRYRAARILCALLLLTLPGVAEPMPGTPNPAQAKPSPQAQKKTARAIEPGATAHKPGDAPPVNEVPVTVVTAATLNTQTPETTATTTTVITHEDLLSAQYNSVADALEKVPGLAVVPSGTPGQVTSVFIHGTDSNQTLFTIDGRRQPVGLDGAYDFTNLTLDDVAQIEVVRTPVSSVQGGSATGGVINLVTLTGRGLKTPESSVSFEGGSYGSFKEQIQSRGSEGKFDYAVSASNWSADMDRANDNYRNDVYRGNFGYQATPDIYLDVHTGYSLANAGSPNSVETPDPVGRLQTEDFFVSPEVTAKVTDFYTTKAYFNHDQTRQNFHDPYTDFDTFQFPTSQRLQLNTNSYDWQNNFQIAGNWQITAGIHGDSVSAYQYDDLVGARTIQNSLTSTGGYAESQWQPIKGLNVLSSVRYDHYSDFEGALSWRQGVSYQVAPTKTIVHASGSSSFTPPSAQELYYPGDSNPLLKPESALGWEAGVEQPLLDGRLTPSATYFHNDITNYVQYAAPTFLPENVGHAVTEGSEIDLAAQPLDELKLDLNYTYLRADNESAQTRLLRRPRHSLNFTVSYTPIKPLTLSFGGSWVASREDIDPVTFAQIDAPDYFILRASATYTINKYVTIWTRGENLTNRTYQPVLGYPALGAAGYGGIKVSF